MRQRVQVVRLPVWYAELMGGHVSGKERAALLARFIETGRKTGISNISEGQSFEAWAKNAR